MTNTTFEAAGARDPAIASRPGEEDLRFVRNFHDVFLSIGIAFFAVGLFLVSALMVGGGLSVTSFSDVQQAGWAFAAAMGVDAAIMWMLAEFFARQRRQFLPSITILLAFTGFVGVAISTGYASFVAGSSGIDPSLSGLEDVGGRLRYMPLVVAAGSMVAVILYYLRTKLPFAMGLGALSITVVAVTALSTFAPDVLSVGQNVIGLVSGIFLFLLGVVFDARDPSRSSRYADNAFWLHLFAAPLIFFSVSAMVGAGVGGSAPAIVTLILVGVFAFISLLINRRALLVSGLLSALWAIGQLVQASGLSGVWTAGVTLLVLGAAMVALGGGWRALRRIVIAPFPKRGFIARIIPPETHD